MKKWHLIIDCALCHDCNNCFLADKDEFVGNDFPPLAASSGQGTDGWISIAKNAASTR